MCKEFPVCRKCGKGVLVPLSDYGSNGATIKYKSWICTNPDCHFNLRIDNGVIKVDGKIISPTKSIHHK